MNWRWVNQDYLFIYLPTYRTVSICLSVCLSIYLPTYVPIVPYLSVCLSIYVSIYLPSYLSVCLSIYLSSGNPIHRPHTRPGGPSHRIWTRRRPHWTLGTRGFSRVRREFSVLAAATRKTSGTERCFSPSPLTFELFYQITFTPITLKVSDCDHVGRHVKKCPKTHIILRKTSSSLKFIALRAIMTGSNRSSP